jgi:hypothetical protein
MLERLTSIAEKHLSPVRKSTSREYFESIGFAILIALMLRLFAIEAFKIPSESMVPSLMVGDHIFVSKFRYGLSLPFQNQQFVSFSKPSMVTSSFSPNPLARSKALPMMDNPASWLEPTSSNESWHFPAIDSKCDRVSSTSTTDPSNDVDSVISPSNRELAPTNGMIEKERCGQNGMERINIPSSKTIYWMTQSLSLSHRIMFWCSATTGIAPTIHECSELSRSQYPGTGRVHLVVQ